MRILALLLPLALSGCIVSTVAKTAVQAVTLPVKLVSAGVNAMTTSQAQVDQKRGREIRKQEQERGRQMREMDDRCRKGRALPTDVCGDPQPH